MTPQNYSGEYLGTVPMYQALANSYNIPAINTYRDITPEKGNAVGREFGLNLNKKMKTTLYQPFLVQVSKQILGKWLKLLQLSRMRV